MGQVFSNFGVAEFYYDSTALRMHVPMNGVVFTPQPVSGGDPASVTNGQTWYNPNLGLRLRHAGVTYTLGTGSGGSTPTGTGFRHVTSGTEDAAARYPAESEVTFTDITTNNASTSAHGFLKKLSNVATEYMDGTGAWSTPAGQSTRNLATGSHLSYDFRGFNGSSSGVEGVPYASTNGTATSVALQGSTAGKPGILRCTSGTSAAAWGSWQVDAATPSHLLGNGPMTLQVGFRIPTLSNGTNRFSAVIATLTDSINNFTNAIVARCRDDVNSGAMVLEGRVGGVVTSANGSTVLAGNTDYVATLVITSTTDVELYLRTYGGADNLEASLTTGIPTAAMFIAGGSYRVLGNGGSVDFDFFQYDQEFTSQR